MSVFFRNFAAQNYYDNMPTNSIPAVLEYAKLCESSLAELLSSDFIASHPDKMDDADIILSTFQRSSSEILSDKGIVKDAAHFSSLVTYIGESTHVQNNVYFTEQHVFKPMNREDDYTLNIAKEDFEYGLSLDTGRNPGFIADKATITCTVDGKYDEEFMHSITGTPLLLCFYIGGINRFGRHVPCFRLKTFSKDRMATVLREEWLKSQYAVLRYLLLYQEYFWPRSYTFPTNGLPDHCYQPIYEACKPYLEQARQLYEYIERKI